jgi:hypothetical protein
MNNYAESKRESIIYFSAFLKITTKRLNKKQQIIETNLQKKRNPKVPFSNNRLTS